jgi:putative PIG3 family NAD(P)H quinone oxidoreductase
MQYIEIVNPGLDYVLKLAETALPVVGDDDVLIRVAAAGVNRADLMQCQGQYPPPSGASTIPGMEVSGMVVQTGSCVERPTVGDHVCALVTGGGYAEYCLAHSLVCLPVPSSVTVVHAAALPEAIFTVWDALYRRARLLPGETVLIHGGTSGIGTTAIQLARAMGSTVIATAGSDDKCAACLKLGAKTAINYKEHDFTAEVCRTTHGHGVDVILDIVGADYFSRNLDSLATEGRMIQISVQSGSNVDLDLVQLMRKRISLHGATLRSRGTSDKALIAEDVRRFVWPLIESGGFVPVISGEFPLASAQAAHELMASSKHIGKILLVCN